MFQDAEEEEHDVVIITLELNSWLMKKNSDHEERNVPKYE
jgi:hypothetical protein